jgi:hypothetical protein
MIRFSIWQDARTDDYEIVLWKDDDPPVVVQTGLWTRAKADQALLAWQQRGEKLKNGVA